jgi:hypothetical protein
MNFTIERELFYGDNLFILETESELYNNTILTYNYLISKDPPLNLPSSPSDISAILITSIVVGCIGVIITLTIFKSVKKRRTSPL